MWGLIGYFKGEMGDGNEQGRRGAQVRGVQVGRSKGWGILWVVFKLGWHRGNKLSDPSDVI